MSGWGVDGACGRFCCPGAGARPLPVTHPYLVSPAALRAISRINAAIRRGMSAETLEALTDPAAQLPDVYPLAAPLYQCQLSLLQRQHPRVRAPQGQAGFQWQFGPAGVSASGGMGGQCLPAPHRESWCRRSCSWPWRCFRL